MRARVAGGLLLLIAGCTEPDVVEPVGLFALVSMNGKPVPLAVTSPTSDTLVSAEMLLRADSIFALYPRYSGPTSGQRITTIMGRWSLSGDSLTYRTTSGAMMAHGRLSSGGISFVQVTDGSVFAFTPVAVDDSAVLSERGSFSINVTGTLSGTTTVSDTSHFFFGLGDYILVYSNGFVLGGKQFSSFGPSDGRDQMTIQINPNLTQPGTYKNNSCAFLNSFGTKCIALTYLVSQPPGTPNTRGSLYALADDRVAIVVEALSFWHVKLTMTGPFEWWPPMPAGVPQQKDTVTVSASVNAFRVR
jgi:hypothetical protein